MELKPCPFCGGAAELDRSTAIRKAKKTEVFRVECSGCHIRDNYWHTSCRAAARAWNTRAERTCQEVEVTARYQPYVTYMTACSLCGGTLAVEEYPAPNYCPNCGAKVVEE